MKTLIFSAAAIVMALSVNSFAGTPEKAEAKPEAKTETQSSTMLHWFTPSGTPAYIQSNTIEDEEEATPGCVPSKLGCERGYRDDQLNTPGVPTSGVKPAQINLPAETLGNQ